MMEIGFSTRERLEKSEQEIRKARSDREAAQCNADRAQRARLEGQSPSAARLGLVNILNGVSDQRAVRELPGMIALEGIRKQQQLGRKTGADHNRTLAKLESEAATFNRLHPSRLERAGGSDGSFHEAPSNFNFGSDPGNRDSSRFLHGERFDPPRRVPKIRDSDGGMDSDARTRADHWNDQGVGGIDPAFVLEVARAIIAMVNSPRYSRNKV